MIPTLLIDDEEHNRSTLRLLLEQHCPDLAIVDEASNVKEAYDKINRHKPRLVFLDIKMPRKTGFDLLKMLPEINFEVIFVTAFNKYAVKAFEFNALGYILKPVDETKLVNVVAKARRRIHDNVNDNMVLHFVKTLSDTDELVNKFSVHHNGHVRLINISDISCIEAGEDNTRITLNNNARYYSSKRLSQFEVMLEGMNNFVRVNKSVIVNIAGINDYTKGELCVINMHSGNSFEVSRRRKSDILRILTRMVV